MIQTLIKDSRKTIWSKFYNNSPPLYNMKNRDFPAQPPFYRTQRSRRCLYRKMNASWWKRGLKCFSLILRRMMEKGMISYVPSLRGNMKGRDRTREMIPNRNLSSDLLHLRISFKLSTAQLQNMSIWINVKQPQKVHLAS